LNDCIIKAAVRTRDVCCAPLLSNQLLKLVVTVDFLSDVDEEVDDEDDNHVNKIG